MFKKSGFYGALIFYVNFKTSLSHSGKLLAILQSSLAYLFEGVPGVIKQKAQIAILMPEGLSDGDIAALLLTSTPIVIYSLSFDQ